MTDNQVLKDPEILVRVAKIKAGLLGTDRDDHMQTVDEWEKKAKRALIAINLQGHEGIQQILEHAKTEIEQINEVLQENKPIDLSPDGAIQYANENARLFDRRAMWQWFHEFFSSAKDDLTEVENEVAMQEAVPEEDDLGG